MTATGTAIDHHHTGIATITIPMCGAKATALAIKQMAIEMAGARSWLLHAGRLLTFSVVKSIAWCTFAVAAPMRLYAAC
eukprot:g15785.t1